MSEAKTVGRRPSLVRSPRRLLLAALGLLCVGLAVVGAVLPGLPTTIFLIAASYLFARSCPWLEERVLGLRLFRPFVPYVRGECAMPRRARFAALAMMWAAVAVSLVSLGLGGALRGWLAAAILAAAFAGSYAILTFRRTSRPPLS